MYVATSIPSLPRDGRESMKKFTQQDIGCFFHTLKDFYIPWNDRLDVFIPKGTQFLLVYLNKNKAKFRIRSEMLAKDIFEFKPKDLQRGEQCCETCHRSFQVSDPILCPKQDDRHS